MPPARSDREPSLLAPRRVFVLLLAVFMGLVAFMVFPSNASAQGEVAWDQFQGDAAHTGVAVSGPAPGYRQAWRTEVEVGNDGLSTPVSDGETVYALGHTMVYAFAADDGKQRWAIPRDEGTLGTPALAVGADDRQLLLFTEGMDKQTALVAIDTQAAATSESSGTSDGTKDDPDKDGSDEPKRVFAVPIGVASRSGVSIEGDVAFVGDLGGDIYAIDLIEGKLSWKMSLGTQPIATPIAASDDAAYVVTSDDQGQGTLTALSTSDGSTKWTKAIGAVGPIASGLTVGDGRVYAGFADRTVRALSAEDGSQEWSRLLLQPISPTSVSPFSTPAFAGGKVIVPGVAGALFALDPATGETVWTYQFLSQRILQSAPVVVGDVVVVGLLEATGRGSALAAVNLESGNQVWELATGTGPIKGIAVTPERLVAGQGGDEGGLRAFSSDPQAVLVDTPSSTTLDPAANAAAFAGALVVVAGLVFVSARGLGGFARRRRDRWRDDLESDDEDEGESDTELTADADTDTDEDPDEPPSKGWR